MNNIKGNSQRLLVLLIVFMTLVGNAMAQGSGRFVIKKKAEGGDASVHYLAHVNNGGTWELQDATTFSPACVWISDNTYTQGGTNKNYYFYDDSDNPRFLSAPSFEAGGALTLSSSLPPASYLNNPEYQYYFYKWDGGLGRGVQYYGVTSEWCTARYTNGWHGTECWEVYWVSYDATSGTWKLSEEQYDLDDVPSGGEFYAVTVTEHGIDITSETGGLGDLTLTNAEMNYPSNQGLSVSPSSYSYNYIPAYTTYVFGGNTHNYWGGADHNTDTPSPASSSGNTVSSYQWTITGDGADYLSFESGSDVLESTSATPTLYYRTENTTGHKTATITVTVTYSDGSTQVRTAEVTVKTACQNPPVSSLSAKVSYEGATVSWAGTADKYKVEWRVKSPVGAWNEAEVENATSYNITGLNYSTEYDYTVSAYCNSAYSRPSAPYNSFTTTAEPGLLLYGGVFGGGRMANVRGNTEVLIINCDSIGSVFGGNDIAGSVLGTDGSTITIGVNAGDAHDYDDDYGTTTSNLKIGSVYGGGNGYYTYDGNNPGPSVGTDVLTSKTFSSSVTEVGGGESYASSGPIPSIVKTAITVTNDYVYVDSIFGGAKNAFITTNSGNGSSIIINGGTIYSVFGGNNFGGTQGYGLHYIEVNGTKTNLTANITNTTTTGYGRTFGIRYIFGGGNKVEGSTTNIIINGGQSDNVFAGGNSADVYMANVTVNCSLASGSGATFGRTYSDAISSTDGTTITVKNNYAWNGTGIYNVRNLFGGNNEAEMKRVPNITLTSGSVGTVYGGGNAGDMMGNSNDNGSGGTLTINGNTVVYGTHIVMNSSKIVIDYLYGGCRMSNVTNSTWVELKKGHVGTVYGGCNISGDVGSTRVYDPYPTGGTYPTTLEEQKVKGATYVQAGAGGSNTDLIVYKNLFAGSNGYYNCITDDGIHYISDVKFDDPTGQYAGLTVPTHNETNVIVGAGTTVKGNVYAGGNLACVGFDDGTGFNRGFPELIGFATVKMTGGIVENDVYGGGNMASIFGINSVRIEGGTIQGALYGGNDKTGQVAEKTNRILPSAYTVASDNKTSLTDLGVKTFVGIYNSANVSTVYGGGNGAYGDYSTIPYCGAEPSLPIQPHTFVDININGGAIGSGGGQIGTVYGGGNGVTIRHGATVFLNVDSPVYDRDHVGTIFGGNNLGNLVVVPDIRLIHGQVGTVYGGCNQGAMMADANIDGINYLKTIGGYENIGSYVRLLDEYDPDGDGGEDPVTVTAKVSNAVYGGCRMNGVTRNSLVLVEGGNHSTVGIYGGSDISGTISGISQVAVTGGTVGTVYGGGNGNYDYTTGDYSGLTAPICATTNVEMVNGTGSTIFGGGYGAGTTVTGNVTVTVGTADGTGTPTVGTVYGGSALGSVNTSSSDLTKVDILSGTVTTVYGGGLGDAGDATKGWVKGKVQVNVGATDGALSPTYTGYATSIGSVFGCNNTNGSPQDDVEVNIYKTAHSGKNLATYTDPDATYVITNVFGGGNQANYAPENGNASSTKKATVHIYTCDNTIANVYGGGNAAAATGVATIIEGGRFDYVFGGGNGTVSPANIGNGGVTITLNGGTINHMFNGSNHSGTIGGTTTVTLNATGCTNDIKEYFCGNNEADITGNVNTIIACSATPLTVTDLYGGSNVADISGNVTLTIQGGHFTNVYGGSKGRLADAPITEKSANIGGNVTVNVNGGTIDNVFGGCNILGAIDGIITVNVFEDGDCDLDLDNVYGGGNQAAYNPNSSKVGASRIVPLVNIQKGTVNENVYGGGYGSSATVTANPKVVVGGEVESTTYDCIVGSVFGGGNAAQVSGDTEVQILNKSTVNGNVYGGGNAAQVTGNTHVEIGE